MQLPVFITRLPRNTVTGLGLVLVGLLGILDYWTGPEMAFSLFYLVPICLVTWLAGKKTGLILGLFGAASWFVADWITARYSSPMVIYWNTITRLVIFLTVSLLLSNLKEKKQWLEDKVKEQTASLREEIAGRKKNVRSPAAERRRISAADRKRQ